ncbi:MAG: superoxide dismutase [Mn] [Planctomycetota bacterium]|nr:MAG: superoxide dismutase [Mn] [Planctomycetota bacterium]
MPHKLPELPYPYDALEPSIDAQTMEIHHQKHHGGYVSKLNAALEGQGALAELPVEQLLGRLDEVPEQIRTAVRNNGGGHANHSLFWPIMAPRGGGGGGEPTGPLAEAIRRDFGSFATFKERFTQAATGLFGSGWTWLGVRDGKLCVCTTPNQDNPLMGPKYVSCPCRPILGLDVWEHAYYLKYQNRRPDYVAAWWEVVNWARVGENFAAAGGQ